MGLTQNLGRLSPSIFSDASLNIGVGAAPSGSYKFEVTGTSKVSGVLTLGSTLSNGTYTYTLPSATGTLALTSQIPSITGLVPYTGATGSVALGIYDLSLSNLSVNNILANNSGTNDIGSSTGNKFRNVYATSFITTSGTSSQFVKGNGTLDSSTYYLASNPSSFIALTSLSAGVGISYNNTTGVITNSAPDQTVALTASTGISVTGTYPNFTITNTSPSSGGTVTSVAALTIGTTGTDLSSTVANSTTTPVITLNVPTASATNRGALSSADWTTFNSKQGTITLTTTGTSGAATFSANTLNIPNYGSALSGYLPLTGGTLTGALDISTGTGTNLTYSLTPSGWNGAKHRFGVPISGDASILSFNWDGTARDYVGYGSSVIGLTDGQITFGVGSGANPTTRLTIASTGVTTFNTSATTPISVISSGTASGLELKNTGTTASDWIIQSDGGVVSGQAALRFYSITASAYRMSIDGSGNVGIGTVSPTNKLHIYGTGANTQTISIESSISAANAYLVHTSTSKSYITGLSTDFSNSYIIYDATAAAARLVVSTGGNVLIGTTTDDTVNKLQVNGSARVTTQLFVNTTLWIQNGSGSNRGLFRECSSGGIELVVSADGGNFNNCFQTVGSTGELRINTLAGTGSRAVLADANGVLSAPVSDISVKENISTIGYGLNEILKMKPVWFNYIDEYKSMGNGRQNGNIAQEMETIIPEAVFTTPLTGKMGINYDQLHAVYIKAIQELKAEIDALKNN